MLIRLETIYKNKTKISKELVDEAKATLGKKLFSLDVPCSITQMYSTLTQEKDEDNKIIDVVIFHVTVTIDKSFQLSQNTNAETKHDRNNKELKINDIVYVKGDDSDELVEKTKDKKVKEVKDET